MTAFEGHGRTKIDRVVVRFVPDENTALVTLLASDVHFSTDRSIRFEQGMELRKHLGCLGRKRSFTLRAAARPADPPTGPTPTLVWFFDVAGRAGAAHALDREALNEGIFGARARHPKCW